MRELETQ
jgi:hypothetical protein